MYLKHLSQTQSTFPPCAPPTFSLINPPANRSLVRPCERNVVRDTPAMRFASGGGCDGAGVCSSASDSVSGYGEKYLDTNNLYKSHVQIQIQDEGRKGGTYQVRI